MSFTDFIVYKSIVHKFAFFVIQVLNNVLLHKYLYLTVIYLTMIIYHCFGFSLYTGICHYFSLNETILFIYKYMHV